MVPSGVFPSHHTVIKPELYRAFLRHEHIFTDETRVALFLDHRRCFSLIQEKKKTGIAEQHPPQARASQPVSV